MRELDECAKALLELNSQSSLESILELINEGYFHLGELRRGSPCNPLLANSLAHRLDGAEALRDKKRSQKEGASL
jgi:hypothetical protein